MMEEGNGVRQLPSKTYKNVQQTTGSKNKTKIYQRIHREHGFALTLILDSSPSAQETVDTCYFKVTQLVVGDS